MSVITAAFDAARYLPAAVESVLGQTYRDWELIVVDDGSTDDTQAVVEPYAARLTLLRQANAGVAAARNAALRAASGELVAVLDADDLWLPTKLQRQVEALDREPAVGVCYCDSRSVDADGRILVERLAGSHRPVTARDLLTGHVPFETSAVMMRRELLGDDPWPRDLGIAEDTYVHVMAVWRGGDRSLFVDEPLSHYRRHAGSVLGRTPGVERGRLIAVAVLRALDDMETVRPLPPSLRRDARAYAFFQQAWYCIDDGAASGLALRELAAAVRCSPRWTGKASRQVLKLGLRRLGLWRRRAAATQ